MFSKVGGTSNLSYVKGTTALAKGNASRTIETINQKASSDTCEFSTTTPKKTNFWTSWMRKSNNTQTSQPEAKKTTTPKKTGIFTEWSIKRHTDKPTQQKVKELLKNDVDKKHDYKSPSEIAKVIMDPKNEETVNTDYFKLKINKLKVKWTPEEMLEFNNVLNGTEAKTVKDAKKTNTDDKLQAQQNTNADKTKNAQKTNTDDKLQAQQNTNADKTKNAQKTNTDNRLQTQQNTNADKTKNAQKTRTISKPVNMLSLQKEFDSTARAMKSDIKLEERKELFKEAARTLNKIIKDSSQKISPVSLLYFFSSMAILKKNGSTVDTLYAQFKHLTPKHFYLHTKQQKDLLRKAISILESNSGSSKEIQNLLDRLNNL